MEITAEVLERRIALANAEEQEIVAAISEAQEKIRGLLAGRQMVLGRKAEAMVLLNELNNPQPDAAECPEAEPQDGADASARGRDTAAG